MGYGFDSFKKKKKSILVPVLILEIRPDSSVVIMKQKPRINGAYLPK